MGFLQDKKSDFYYKQAKEQNYRARSAFKLLEIQKKFNLIRAGDKVLDLGASPGGWSQVALEFIDGGKVIGVDKKILSKLNGNFKFVFGDFTEEKTLNEIKEHLSGKADVVLCDASPEFSGIKSMDMGLSLELNKAALEIAKDLLKIKGKFVCKTFRGVGFQEFIKDVKIHFIAVSIFKPKSSKSDSAEIYLIATGFRKAQLSKL